MSRVLVTDGEQRAALAIVRSLGAAGHDVFVCSTRPRSLAGASRHARGQAAVPDPLGDPAAFIDAVQDLIARWNVTVLLPVTDAALLATLPARHRFPHVLLPFPPPGTVRRLADKALVLSAAAEVGIAVPEQHHIPCRGSIERFLSGLQLEFPVVIKPARSVTGSETARQKFSVSHAADDAQLRRRLAALPDAAFPVLVQRRVEGPGVGVFVLLWDGALQAVFAHRRIREKPPSGGVSVYRESIPADPALVDLAVALLRGFEWQGVAMVEFKVDGRTGTPYLMEVNGRFWGSLQLAIDAGVDFPSLLLRHATGTGADPVTGYRAGVRSRWWWGDVDHLIARLRRSPAELDLPPGSPGRLAALQDFLKVKPSVDRNEVLRSSDPLPFLRESIDWLRNR